MRIVSLKKSELTYSCNSYLILGDWNRIEDVNTVIDPGADSHILAEIERLSTGFGKTPVAQIILTHGHFDHIGGIRPLKERYGCRVLAFSDGPDVDEVICHGQVLKAGDGVVEVIHTPGHSTDSICLYAPKERALFCGDTQLHVTRPGLFSREYLVGLLKVAQRTISTIYSGHDAPVTKGAQAQIRETLSNVRHSEFNEGEETDPEEVSHEGIST